MRVLGSGKSQKNDPNDALSTAVAALRNRRLHPVVADDHAVILRLLSDRHHDLTRLRTQAVCRLHAMLANLVPGGRGWKSWAGVGGPRNAEKADARRRAAGTFPPVGTS